MKPSEMRGRVLVSIDHKAIKRLFVDRFVGYPAIPSYMEVFWAKYSFAISCFELITRPNYIIEKEITMTLS